MDRPLQAYIKDAVEKLTIQSLKTEELSDFWVR